MKNNIITTVLLAAGTLGVMGLLQQARADNPASIKFAIPKNVTVIVGATRVTFIGAPTSTSAVTCTPGTPQPQSVVATHPTGGHASQITGLLAFHDHALPNGTRYRISGGPNVCNADLDLYDAVLD